MPKIKDICPICSPVRSQYRAHTLIPHTSYMNNICTFLYIDIHLLFYYHLAVGPALLKYKYKCPLLLACLLGCELRVRSETYFIRTKNGYGPKRDYSVPRFCTTSGPWLATVAPSWAKANRELNNLLRFSVSGIESTGIADWYINLHVKAQLLNPVPPRGSQKICPCKWETPKH